MKSNAYTSARIAINHLTVYHDLLALAKRNAHQQQRALGQVGLRVHVKSTSAYVLGAGHSGRVFAVKENIYNQT